MKNSRKTRETTTSGYLIREVDKANVGRRLTFGGCLFICWCFEPLTAVSQHARKLVTQTKSRCCQISKSPGSDTISLARWNDPKRDDVRDGGDRDTDRSVLAGT